MNLTSITRRRAGALAALVLALGLAACDQTPSRNQQTTQSAPQYTAPVTQTASPPPVATPSASAAQASPVVQGEASLDTNIYVVFDGSGSMDNCPPRPGYKENERNPDGKCEPKIVGARNAVLEVGKTLPATVNLGYYVFDNDGRNERLALGSNNNQKFVDITKRIRAGGSTPLGPAMSQGIDALEMQYKKQLGYGEYRLIVVTDGMPDSMSDVEQQIRRIRKSGLPIAIYTISFGLDDPHHPLQKASANYVLAYTGAQVKDALQESVSESPDFDPSGFQSK